MTREGLFSRRAFLASAAAAPALTMASRERTAKNVFPEPSRDLPLADCDVIVAGGGPAGISAAVAAARAGAKVRLFEMHGALGGIWTSGFLGCLIDFDKSETDREILRRLRELDALCERRPVRKGVKETSFVYDPEIMKMVCEEMCAEAGVEFFLHTTVVAAHRDLSGRNIGTVVTESKSGRRAWRAKAYIDCTGDGDLAALCGCGFDVGGPGGTNDQPASLCAMVASPHPDRIAPYVVNHPSNYDASGRQTESPKRRMREEMVRAGLDPSYSMPTLFMVREGVYVWMMNHVYGLKVDDAAGITRETVRVRREVLEGARALARLGGAWEGFCVVATAEQIGHRAARRIHGRYTLTVADVQSGAVFPDAVTTSNFNVDVHATTAESNKKAAYGSMGVKSRPFQIPLRACWAKDVDNLYLAGRCISGDFISMSSYRVTGSAVAMGEAVGRAAARAQT
ncbi:MAG: FAD-dependent oxidoreductase [Kiritimatiellae bacterium]|nr:FAD-dependent oxidoreductase [Kiritimatiellia bacterium]